MGRTTTSIRFFIPGGRILYTTNNDVEKFLDLDSPSQQFKDEYERATTAQVGTITMDGSAGAGRRNVSHRVSPALLPDGHVRLHGMAAHGRHQRRPPPDDQRRHDGDAGGVRRRAEGRPTQHQQLSQGPLRPDHAIHATDGQTVQNYQMVAIATSRDRTLQAGKLFLLNLKGARRIPPRSGPRPPRPRRPARPWRGGPVLRRQAVGNPAEQKFLVSWSDGRSSRRRWPSAKSNAQFGIYLFDAKHANDWKRRAVSDWTIRPIGTSWPGRSNRVRSRRPPRRPRRPPGADTTIGRARRLRFVCPRHPAD